MGTQTNCDCLLQRYRVRAAQTPPLVHVPRALRRVGSLGLMANDDGPSTAWGRVAAILIALLIAFLLIGLVLKLLKWAIYAALIVFGVALLARATRSGRR